MATKTVTKFVGDKSLLADKAKLLKILEDADRSSGFIPVPFPDAKEGRDLMNNLRNEFLPREARLYRHQKNMIDIFIQDRCK